MTLACLLGGKIAQEKRRRWQVPSPVRAHSRINHRYTWITPGRPVHWGHGRVPVGRLDLPFHGPCLEEDGWSLSFDFIVTFSVAAGALSTLWDLFLDCGNWGQVFLGQFPTVWFWCWRAGRTGKETPISIPEMNAIGCCACCVRTGHLDKWLRKAIISYLFKK